MGFAVTLFARDADLVALRESGRLAALIWPSGESLNAQETLRAQAKKHRKQAKRYELKEAPRPGMGGIFLRNLLGGGGGAVAPAVPAPRKPKPIPTPYSCTLAAIEPVAKCLKGALKPKAFSAPYYLAYFRDDAWRCWPTPPPPPPRSIPTGALVAEPYASSTEDLG